MSEPAPKVHSTGHDFCTRTTEWTLGPKDKDTGEVDSVCEYTTVVKIKNEGEGDFVGISQPYTDNTDSISITRDEWTELRKLIDNIFEERS